MQRVHASLPPSYKKMILINIPLDFFSFSGRECEWMDDTTWRGTICIQLAKMDTNEKWLINCCWVCDRCVCLANLSQFFMMYSTWKNNNAFYFLCRIWVCLQSAHHNFLRQKYKKWLRNLSMFSDVLHTLSISHDLRTQLTHILRDLLISHVATFPFFLFFSFDDR